MTRSFMICVHEVKESELGCTFGTYGVQERYIQGFGGDTWGKETT